MKLLRQKATGKGRTGSLRDLGSLEETPALRKPSNQVKQFSAPSHPQGQCRTGYSPNHKTLNWTGVLMRLRGHPRSSTYSTRAHRPQATAPQLQQMCTHRPHRARSHWPHTAFPSSARTHEEQALVVALDGSVRKKCHLSAPQGISSAGGCGTTVSPTCGQRADLTPCTHLPLDPPDNLQESTARRPLFTRETPGAQEHVRGWFL